MGNAWLERHEKRSSNFVVVACRQDGWMDGLMEERRKGSGPAGAGLVKLLDTLRLVAKVY